MTQKMTVNSYPFITTKGISNSTCDRGSLIGPNAYLFEVHIENTSWFS